MDSFQKGSLEDKHPGQVVPTTSPPSQGESAQVGGFSFFVLLGLEWGKLLRCAALIKGMWLYQFWDGDWVSRVKQDQGLDETWSNKIKGCQGKRSQKPKSKV